MEPLITTEPVKISPNTRGTGVPALPVCCVPPKLNDNLGSSSELNSCLLGSGVNISDTPVSSKAIPKFPTAAIKGLAAAPPVAIKPMPFDPKENPRLSFSFGGTQQTGRAGTPVPLVYGEIFTGSVVISGSIDTEQVQA